MKKTLPLFFLLVISTLSACASQEVSTPTPLPAPAAETQMPTAIPPTTQVPSANRKDYANSAFGLAFQFPSNWFGPDEYISGQDLRVAVGSDVVYPYGGTQPEQPSKVKNSYIIVIQYSKHNQNSYWEDTYQSLLNLKDGKFFSGPRSLVTRVRQLNPGRFVGFEYITTLPEAAQTDPVYIREVMLFDKQSNDLLTIMGTLNNVEVSAGSDWRAVYRKIDEANLAIFYDIVGSITLK